MDFEWTTNEDMDFDIIEIEEEPYIEENVEDAEIRQTFQMIQRQL